MVQVDWSTERPRTTKEYEKWMNEPLKTCDGCGITEVDDLICQKGDDLIPIIEKEGLFFCPECLWGNL